MDVIFGTMYKIRTKHNEISWSTASGVEFLVSYTIRLLINENRLLTALNIAFADHLLDLTGIGIVLFLQGEPQFSVPG